MRALIDALERGDYAESDFPEVALVHDSSGWMLNLRPGGILTWENLNAEDRPPAVMRGVSRNRALELWRRLARGEIEALQQEPWESP